MDWIVLVALLLLPLPLLGDCLLGGRAYVPWDLREYPPVATTMAPEQTAALRAFANADATEPPTWFVPELRLARQALLAGEYPHWNPYVRGGAPLTAHGHLGLLDPLHWPALLFADPHDGLLYLTTVMFVLAGLLAHGFLRALQLDRLPALFGAVAFAWSGTLAANGHWFQRMEPLAMLPGALWAALACARRHGRARALPAAGLAACVLCIWTAGFPPFCIPVTLWLLAFGAVLLVVTLRRDGRRAAVVLAAWLGLGCALGLALAMPQVLQQIAFFPHSNRPPDPGLAMASRSAFAPCGLLGYVFPGLFGHPVLASIPGDRSPLAWLLSDLHEWGTGRQLFPNWNFTEYSVFPGTLTLLLAVVGLVARGPRWRLLVAAAMVGTIVLAAGIGPARYAFALPGLASVPPYRFLGPGCLFVATLAACGFQVLAGAGAPRVARGVAIAAALVGGASLWIAATTTAAKTTPDDPWLTAITARYRDGAAERIGVAPAAVTPELALAAVFTIGREGQPSVDLIREARQRLSDGLRSGGLVLWVAAAFLVLLARRGPRALTGWPAWAALALTGFELWSYGRPLNIGRDVADPDSAVHEFLRDERDRHAGAGGFMVARGKANLFDLPSGTLVRERIRDLNCYTFVDGRSGAPLRAIYGDAFMIRDYLPSPLADDARLASPWWDVIGLRYVLATQPMRHAGARVGPRLQGPQGEFFVYERTTALPRARVVPQVVTVDTDGDAVRAVTDPSFAAATSVVMTRDEAAALGPLAAADPACMQRQCTFVHEDADELVLRIDAGAPGQLVLADTWMPGWTLAIDGQPAPIARGNVCLRVARVPATACELHFRYCTPGLWPGLTVAAIALPFVILLLWLGYRARAVPPLAAAPT